MSHVLTVKIPHPLLDRLEMVCSSEGKTKGALVREAVEKMLEEKSEQEEGLARIRRVTDAHLKGKRVKAKVDWERLRRKAMESAPDMTPEEEVRYHRTRGLL
jgi:predicted DNA-binding protein